MSVQVLLSSKLTATETSTDGYVDSSNNSIGTNGLDTTKTLNSGSTPAVSVQASFQIAMSGGAATLDLTAITDRVTGAIKSGNGLRIISLKLRNKSTNANSISVVPGASNGYQYKGSDWKTTLSPGDEELHYSPTSSQTVGSSHKTLDISGTLAQVLEGQIVFG